MLKIDVGRSSRSRCQSSSPHSSPDPGILRGCGEFLSFSRARFSLLGAVELRGPGRLRPGDGAPLALAGLVRSDLLPAPFLPDLQARAALMA
jgi:hypothetical protein